MIVVIESHWRNERWEGEIPDPTHAAPDVAPLDYIFRFFNRVDQADNARLEALGYRLPSLSVGDSVTLGDQRWTCAPVGWQQS